MAKRIEISIHSIIRFAERVFMMPESQSKALTAKQTTHISNLIEEALFDHGDAVLTIGEGEFKCEDYGIIIVVREFKVTTIKLLDPADDFNKQFNGGRKRVERRENSISSYHKRTEQRNEQND